MKRSKQASVMVKIMVASNPNLHCSLMVASDPQFAGKFRPQSKMKPKKNKIIHMMTKTMKTRDVIWNPENTNNRR